MPSYDLLSSDQRERILNEILLDKMEEAEEIQNSLPNGFVSYHDNDDFHDYEEERRREDARRDEEIIYVGYGSTRRAMKRKDYEEFRRKRHTRMNSNKR